MNYDVNIITIIAPAFFAGAIISIAHILFGIEVIKRGIIFLDLAVAQFAALGMIAFYVFFENHDMAPEYAAVGSLIFGLGMALFCSVGLNMLERHTGKFQEAFIGCSFIFAASLSILIMAGDPHGGEQIKDILAGQILWITWKDLFIYGPIFLLVAGIWLFFDGFRARLFYVLFALTIPFSVSLIGVYLVFASLILPALVTVKTNNYRVLKAYFISIASFAAGLLFSYFLDLPSGPAIVIAMFMVSIFYYIFLCEGKIARKPAIPD